MIVAVVAGWKPSRFTTSMAFLIVVLNALARLLAP